MKGGPSEAAKEAATEVAYAELHCEHDDELSTFKGFGCRVLAAAHDPALTRRCRRSG